MKIDARIVSEIRAIIDAREKTAPARPKCPLCKITDPRINVLDHARDRVYIICLKCAWEYIDTYKDAANDQIIKSILDSKGE